MKSKEKKKVEKAYRECSECMSVNAYVWIGRGAAILSGYIVIPQVSA